VYEALSNACVRSCGRPLCFFFEEINHNTYLSNQEIVHNIYKRIYKENIHICRYDNNLIFFTGSTRTRILPPGELNLYK
jgi:hypothetical protein